MIKISNIVDINESKNLDLDEYKEGMIVRIDNIVYKLVNKYRVDTSEHKMYIELLSNKVTNDMPQTLKYFHKTKQIDILAKDILNYHEPFAHKPIKMECRIIGRSVIKELPKSMHIEVPEGAAIELQLLYNATSNYAFRVIHRISDGVSYCTEISGYDSKREAIADGWDLRNIK